jgi:Protein of unknown function (DUF2458)
MNPNQDPQAALASLLAILTRSAPNQTPQNTSTSHSHPQHSPPQCPPAVHQPSALEHLEPVFAEDSILETTQWIGVPTTQWYEPRKWQFPRSSDVSTTQQAHLPGNVKRRRSPSPVQPTKQLTSPATAEVTTFPTYSHALKHVIQQSETKEFMDAIRDMKKRQNDLESDLFEERMRITQKWDSKRKVNQVLQSLGSQHTSEEVLSHKYGLTEDDVGSGDGRVKEFRH